MRRQCSLKFLLNPPKCLFKSFGERFMSRQPGSALGDLRRELAHFAKLATSSSESQVSPAHTRLRVGDLKVSHSN